MGLPLHSEYLPLSELIGDGYRRSILFVGPSESGKETSGERVFVDDFASLLKRSQGGRKFIFAVRPYAHGLSMHTLRTHDKHLKNLGNDDAVENDDAGRGTYLRKHEVFQFQSHASKHGGRRELCLLCTKSR